MKYISLIIAVIIILSASAQTPPPPQADETFHRSASQKGVEISSDVLVVALPVAAATITALNKDLEGAKQIAYTAAATAGATLLLKFTIKKERPDHSNFHSMPSGHTATGFATAAYIQRRYGWKFGVPAYALATYVGWARIYSKKHDIWDVLAGAAIGAGSAYIFTRPFAKKHDLKIAPVTDGQSFIISASMTF